MEATVKVVNKRKLKQRKIANDDGERYRDDKNTETEGGVNRKWSFKAFMSQFFITSKTVAECTCVFEFGKFQASTEFKKEDFRTEF